MGRTGEAQDNAANDRLTDQQTQFYNEQNQAIQNYNTQLAAITKQGNPYTQPAYLQNEQSLINEATTASNKANAEGVKNEVGRTGTNTASLQYTKAKMSHDAAQANAATLVGQRANDYQNANAWDQWLLGAQLGSAGAAGAGYGTATSGDSAALNNLTQLGLASYGPINSLIGAAGTVGAAALGKPPSGCWIAAAVFDGWDDSRTMHVRYWLNKVWAKQSCLGAVTMALYRTFGEQVAVVVRRSEKLQRALLPLFNLALARACEYGLGRGR